MSMPKPLQEMVHEECRRRGIEHPDPDLNECSKAILKNAWLDNKFFLLTVANRIQHSLPLHPVEEEEPAVVVTAVAEPYDGSRHPRGLVRSRGDLGKDEIEVVTAVPAACSAP